MTERQSGGSRSIRAAISACTVSGIRSGAPPPSSARSRTVSSRKSGLPSVLSSSASRTPGGSAPATSPSTSCSASSCGSGPSSIEIERRRPPPQPGRASSSSGRARHTISTGASSMRSARCSTRSSSGSSAQCTSSNPSTSGCASARFVAHSCAAQAISCPRRSPETLSSTPDARPSRSATASRRARLLELLERLVGRVVGRDPGRHLHHLGQREVREPLAEGQRAAGEDGRPLEPGEELPREAALPDPRLAVDRHELRAPVADDARVHVAEQVELLLAPDVRRRHVHGPADRPLGAHDAAHARGPPGRP